jgi:hypothetical protein
LLLRRQHLALVCAAATAVAHYVLGALVSGWSWPLAWLRMMLEYRDLEWASNQYTHVSLWALFAQLLSPRWAPACAAAATLVVLWIVGTRALHATPASSFWGLAIAGTVLVSLHMQYYDAAVLLLPVLQGLEAQRRANLEPSLRSRLTLALGYVLYPIYVYGPGLGFQPLCLWAVLSFGWLASQTNAIGASELRRGSTSIRQGS